MARNRPFAVRVVVTHATGSTTERTYVRPRNMALSRQAFAAFALGDLLLLIEADEVTSMTVEECDVPMFA